MNNRKLLLGLMVLLGFALGYYFFQKDKVSNEDTINTMTEEQVPGEGSLDENASADKYQPQYTVNKPRQESVDPFIIHNDFEILLESSKNKSDFDFSFAAFEEKTPKYKLNNGKIDFELKGTLRTDINLENNVALNVEFYNNNQVSFTQRQKHSEHVLPFLKENAKKESTEKNLYRFDFEESISLVPGLYYFIIAPNGRNRVLYAGKFEVR